MRIGSGNLKIARANRLGNLTFPINSFPIHDQKNALPPKDIGRAGHRDRRFFLWNATAPRHWPEAYRAFMGPLVSNVIRERFQRPTVSNHWPSAPACVAPGTSSISLSGNHICTHKWVSQRTPLSYSLSHLRYIKEL